MQCWYRNRACMRNENHCAGPSSLTMNNYVECRYRAEILVFLSIAFSNCEAIHLQHLKHFFVFCMSLLGYFFMYHSSQKVGFKLRETR